MADFIFRVSSVNLKPEQQSRIAAAIQGAVLTEIANLDLAPPSTPDCLFRPPRGRYGGLLIAVEKAEVAAKTTLGISEKPV
jgi:hypothetical protein